MSGVGSLRNKSMAALARDLLGTAAEFLRLGQPTPDEPYNLFIDACRRCADGKGWNDREWETIWKSASKKTPVSSLIHHLGPKAVENCIKSWYWREIVQPQLSEAKQETEQKRNKKQISATAKSEEEISGESSSARSMVEDSIEYAEYSSNTLISDYRRTARYFGKRIRLNKLTQKIEIDGKPISLDRAKLQLAVRYGVNLVSSKENVQDIIAELAEQNEYSPIAEYLLSLPETEDTSILDRISSSYFGVTDPIYTVFIRKTLIAAVARALKPGCKVDTALILQGDQGLKKSWFFKILAGDYFDDSMGAASDKDERLKLHRNWVIEWSELERIIGRKDVSSTKAFITSETDFVRPPYCRDIQEFKRPSIIVGTTNQEEFLVDATGNRRFWIIPVQKKVDVVRLVQERDEIWTAAIAAYRSEELCYLTDDEEIKAEAIALEFHTSDPWEDAIANYCCHREFVRTTELLDHLQIDIGRQERAHQMRCSNILKLMGWVKSLKIIDGRRVRGWERPIDPPEPPPTLPPSPMPDMPTPSQNVPALSDEETVPELPAPELCTGPTILPPERVNLPPDLPADLPDLPPTEVDREVDHPETQAESEFQKSDQPDLPKTPKKTSGVETASGEIPEENLATENLTTPDLTLLGEKVDQVDHPVNLVAETPAEQGKLGDLPRDRPPTEVDQVDREVDRNPNPSTSPDNNPDNSPDNSLDDETSELVGMVRSAITQQDPEFAVQIQGILREVVGNGAADRQKVWGALTSDEQTAFKALLPEPISEEDANKIREVVLTWWDEVSPERLQTMLFGFGQPCHKNSRLAIAAWLQTQAPQVVERVNHLLEIRKKRPENPPPNAE